MREKLELEITPSDRRSPQSWLLAIGVDGLRAWLREALWNDATDPVHFGDGVDFADHLGALVSGTPQLLTRCRVVLPGLTNEWRSGEPIPAIVGLLSLNKKLQVVGSEGAIRRLLNRELHGGGSELEQLRGLACRTLVQLGPSKPSAHQLWLHLDDPHCVGPCFRGLYELDLGTLRRSFPRVLSTLGNHESEVTELLRGLLRRRIDPDQLPEVLPLLALRLTNDQLKALPRLVRPLGFEVVLERGTVFDYRQDGLLVAKFEVRRFEFDDVYDIELDFAEQAAEHLERHGSAPTLDDVLSPERVERLEAESDG